MHVVSRAQSVSVQPFALDIESGSKSKQQQTADDTQSEDGGQQVDEFQCAGMALFEVDAGDAAVVDLTEELAEVRATLVPHPRLREEPWLIASLGDAVAEVDVLAEAHLRKTAEFKIDITADAHVKGTGIELIELGLAPTDAASGEEGGHGVGDGLLDRREGGVRGIGTAKGGDV